MPVGCVTSAEPWELQDRRVHVRQNFYIVGICYSISAKTSLLTALGCERFPFMCTWLIFQNAPKTSYNVPVLASIWLGALNTHWMMELWSGRTRLLVQS